MFLIMGSFDWPVRPQEYQWSEQQCAANGGLDRMDVDLWDVEAWCNNDAHFSVLGIAAPEGEDG